MNAVKIRGLVIGEGIPKICVPIVGKTREEILKAAKDICVAQADLVEWRVDWFEQAYDINAVTDTLLELRNVLGNIPLLFTFRTKNEGGEREISFEQYSELLLDVSKTKHVDLVDVEVFFDGASLQMEQFVCNLQQAGVKVVGSNHDFEKTPDKAELISRLCHMQSLGVDIPKIAVMPSSKQDVLMLLDATEEMVSNKADRPIITMSMTGRGIISRIAGEFFGSSVTFATVGKASAPGQISADAMKDILKIMHCSCDE